MKGMVIFFGITLFLICSPWLCPEQLGVLEGLYMPVMLEIAHGRVYCVQETTVFTYDLGTLKLQKKFCKPGEGPDELKIIPSINSYLIPLDKSMMIVGVDKAIIYSADGNMEEEIRFPQMSANYLFPLKKGSFLGLKFDPGDYPTGMNLVAGIYDKEFKMTKELYKQRFTGGQNLVNLTPDGINLAVGDNKIFIEQSGEGFIISIFNLEGKLINTIKKNVPLKKYSREHEENTMNLLQNNPVLKGIGWENFKQMVKFIHDDYLPPIKDMVVDGGKIYLMTYRVKEGNVEFLVMDQAGKVLKEIFLPEPTATDYFSVIFGRPTRYYKISDGKYYYLKENIEDETWELYAITI